MGFFSKLKDLVSEEVKSRIPEDIEQKVQSQIKDVVDKAHQSLNEQYPRNDTNESKQKKIETNSAVVKSDEPSPTAKTTSRGVENKALGIVYPLLRVDYENTFNKLKQGDLSAFVDIHTVYFESDDNKKKIIKQYLDTLYNDTKDQDVLALLHVIDLCAGNASSANSLVQLAQDGSIYAKYYLGYGGARPRFDESKKSFNDKPANVDLGISMLQDVVDILETKDDNYRKAYHTAYGLLSQCYWLIRNNAMGQKDSDNVVKAFHYASIGIKYNDSISYFVLSDMYVCGVTHKELGVVAKQDYNESLNCMKKSLQYCTVFEMNIHLPILLANLGMLIYSKFRDLDPKLTKVAELFQLSAEFNYGYACWQLKVFYENGMGGLEKDLFKAMQMRDRAVAAGYRG